MECTVNGRVRVVRVGLGMQDLIGNGYASPKAGNLVSIPDAQGQSSLLAEGAGNSYTLTVNGAPADPATYRVAGGETLEFFDGTDKTEDSTKVVSEVACGVTLPARGYYLSKLGYISQWGSQGETTVETGLVSGITIDRGVTTQPQDFKVAVAGSVNPSDGRLLAALTFNGGPSPLYTRQYLDILARYGARATFFCVGSQVALGSDYAAVVKRCADEGHQVASGGYSGCALTSMTAAAMKEDLDQSFAVLKEAAGVSTNVLRAPYGSFYGDDFLSYVRAGGDLAYVAYWGIDSQDSMYSAAGGIESGAAQIASTCIGRLASNPLTYNGAIILMHDGGQDLSCTLVALPQVIEAYQAAGFELVTLNEMLAACGGFPDWVCSGYLARPEDAYVPPATASVTYYTP